MQPVETLGTGWLSTLLDGWVMDGWVSYPSIYHTLLPLFTDATTPFPLLPLLFSHLVRRYDRI